MNEVSFFQGTSIPRNGTSSSNDNSPKGWDDIQIIAMANRKKIINDTGILQFLKGYMMLFTHAIILNIVSHCIKNTLVIKGLLKKHPYN